MRKFNVKLNMTKIFKHQSPIDFDEEDIDTPYSEREEDTKIYTNGLLAIKEKAFKEGYMAGYKAAKKRINHDE